MNYNRVLLDYIDKCCYDEPIFIEDIKKYILDITNENGDDFNKVIKNIYVYINRMVKKGEIEFFAKGIYYKPTIGVFGKRCLDVTKVIEQKYLTDNCNIKGYVAGAHLYNELGLTTQVPRNILIITNECITNNDYEIKNLNINIRKPKIEVNNDNYLYLQLLDLLANKDNIGIEIDNPKKIIYDYINENNLDFEKIFYYAKITNNKKAIDKLYNLG